MNPAQHYADAKGLDLPAFVQAADLLHIDGAWSIMRWDEGVLGPKPSEDDLAKVVAIPDPSPKPIVPDVISDRQFFQQLAGDGDITEDEALAAVTTGTLPKKLSDAIAELPAEQQFPAKMLCCGATEFRRTNPMVPVLGQALGKNSDELDEIWTSAAKI